MSKITTFLPPSVSTDKITMIPLVSFNRSDRNIKIELTAHIILKGTKTAGFDTQQLGIKFVGLTVYKLELKLFLYY